MKGVVPSALTSERCVPLESVTALAVMFKLGTVALIAAARVK